MNAQQSDTAEFDIPDEMSFDEALAFAVRLLKDQELDAAGQIFAALLSVAPGHPDILHFLGVLKHRRAELDDAVKLIRMAIEAVPDFPDYHLNLGNVLVEQGEIDAALAEFEEVLRLRPESPDVWSNLGSVYRAKGRDAEAEQAYHKAIELDQNHVAAHNNLGVLYSRSGRNQQAFDYFCKAIVLSPTHTKSYRLLAIAYERLGEVDKAADTYRQWMKIEPDNAVPRHHLAACLGLDTPERASDEYIIATFDSFAASFEDVLLSNLHYRAPQLIISLVGEQLGPPAADLDVLDAGCGTGLCGPLIAERAKSLTGVDLSAGMLDKARGKNCYDRLEKAELTTYLQQHPARYDLIVSADTLCYFGSLEAVSAAAAVALRADGHLGFTVEALPDDATEEGFCIQANGRFRHSRAHLGACLEQAGLEIVRVEDAHLRTEAAEPVEGLVVIARKPAR